MFGQLQDIQNPCLRRTDDEEDCQEDGGGQDHPGDREDLVSGSGFYRTMAGWRGCPGSVINCIGESFFD